MAEQDAAVRAGRTGSELRRSLEVAPSVCPVCRCVGEAVRRYVETLFYEMVNDIPTRETLRASSGFCRRHAALIRRHADALGTAVIFQDVLGNVLRSIEAGAYDRPPETGSGLLRFLDGSPRERDARSGCPICAFECETEDVVVDSLFPMLHDPDFRTLYARSPGLCLPHFRLAFARCRDADAWKMVLEVEKAALSSLVAELAELARKYDYRFRNEAVGAEADSWQRALDVASGWVEE